MKRFLLVLITLVAIIPAQNHLKAQSTYAQVYQLLQANCSGSGCHDGTGGRFNINVSADSFYNEVINATPVNSAAAAKFNKIIAPGQVQTSFLLRKIAHGISDGLVLNQPAEGLDMPNGLPALKNFEIELVRQWILFGAPDTGTVVDTALINNFYRNGGVVDTYSPHEPPAAGTGFQIYLGTIFLPRDTDVEYFSKYDPHLTAAIESPEVVTMLPSSTHHFVVFSFLQGQDVLYPWGLRQFADNSMNSVSQAIGATAGRTDIMLPPHTAYFFNVGQMLDIDIHVQNPNVDSTLATDIYVNVLTQPVGTAASYMTMTNFGNESISIPEDGQPHMFSSVAYDSSQTQYYKIWKLYSHTHKYGTAFNIWLRNPDGSKGAQVYDGDYSYEDGYEVGYYRWGNHATDRTFPGDSLFQVDPRLGFIWETTYINTAGPNPVIWGNTLYYEMDIMGFFGIPGDNLPTAVSTIANEDLALKVFPNPVTDEFVVQYQLSQPSTIQIDILDILGNKVANLVNNQAQATGQYTHEFNTSDYKLPPGIYLVSFNVGGKVETQKLVVTE